MSSINYRNDVQCGVLEISYVTETQTGTLIMEDGHCCDMAGCIRLFTTIDANVKKIMTFQLNEPDTFYWLTNDGQWTSGLMRF